MNARTEHADLLAQVASCEREAAEVRRILGTLTGAELDARNAERLHAVNLAIGSKFVQTVPSFERRGLNGSYTALMEFPGSHMNLLQRALLNRRKVIQTRSPWYVRLVRALWLRGLK